MRRKIVAIGLTLEVTGMDLSSHAFDAGVSLLDADIIIFSPRFHGCYHAYSRHEGKRSFGNEESAAVKRHSEHWRREIQLALAAGNNIFVFLEEREEILVEVSVTYSDAAKNARRTTNVAPYDNYQWLPCPIGTIVNSKGSAMKVAPLDRTLASYWSALGVDSEFQAYVDDFRGTPLLLTKSGEKTVGGRLRLNSSAELFFLPTIKDLERSDERSFVAAILEIDKLLRDGAKRTPAPEWTRSAAYESDLERNIASSIGELAHDQEALTARVETLKKELAKAGSLAPLLYENGLVLECALREALDHLGFATSTYKDAHSEFDVVFECAEGRLLGEAEGKDNGAIDVSKLRQLEMNLHEDLAREEVQESAKGVLFGNAHRLLPPADRPASFTAKCMTAAKRSRVALVRTADLYAVAIYLRDHPDNDFASRCRTAILAAEGEVVGFPALPSSARLAVSEHDDSTQDGGGSSARE